MYEQIEKPKENNSRAVTKCVGQKKSKANQDLGSTEKKTVKKRVKAESSITPNRLLSKHSSLLMERNYGSFGQQPPIQLGRFEKGRWVSDGEIHHRKLKNEFYPTYEFVTKVEDGEYISPNDGRRKIIDPEWLKLWGEYDELWATASKINNMANVNKNTGGGNHEWEEFAVDTPLHNKKLQIDAEGGFLKEQEVGPGPIPMKDHPAEVEVDELIQRAKNAYEQWSNGEMTFQNRGTDDDHTLSSDGLKRLKKRTLPQNWTLQPSISKQWALHRAGNEHAPEDPNSPNGKMTYIYHLKL